VKIEPTTLRTELPLANLDGAVIYSEGWVPEDERTYAVWFELPNGSIALATFTLGGPLGQDQRPRVVCGPGRAPG
jgi:hypothetical protein